MYEGGFDRVFDLLLDYIFYGLFYVAFFVLFLLNIKDLLLIIESQIIVYHTGGVK